METVIGLNFDRIEFIDQYCDRWCERCPFTSRCSAYAVQAAIAMCDGDVLEGLELAVGDPPPGSAAEEARRNAFHESLLIDHPTEEEVEEVRREEEARDERVDESPVTTAAERFSTLARAWLVSKSDAEARTSNRDLEDAIEIASWDASLIGAKLHRALHGRDADDGTDCDEDPVQNDWNGSAKVALISIRRSIRAWDTIAAATADVDAAGVAEELRRLEAEAEQTFPDARKFIRPGFDQAP